MFDPAKFPILIDGSVILISKLYIILYIICYTFLQHTFFLFYLCSFFNVPLLWIY